MRFLNLRLNDGSCNPEQLQAIYAHLTESQNEEFPKTKTLHGYTIQINKNVFDPVIFPGGGIFGKMLPIKKGCHFLEVGCGSGIVSLIAAKRGAAKILALDITEDALNNTIVNMKRYKFEDIINTRISDVFNGLSKEETFDEIFWNPPFFNVPKLDLTSMEKTIADCNYENLKRYIADGHHYLTPNGRLRFGFSTTLGNINILHDFAQSCEKKISLLNHHTIDAAINLGIKMKYELFEVRFL